MPSLTINRNVQNGGPRDPSWLRRQRTRRFDLSFTSRNDSLPKRKAEAEAAAGRPGSSAA